MSAPEVWTKAVGFKELALLLRDGTRTIAASIALVLVCSVTLALLSHMRFRVKGSLYLGDVQSREGRQSNMPDQFDFSGGRRGDVGTEVEILKSDALIERAIVESGLNVKLTPVGWRPPRYLNWLLLRRNLDALDLGTRRVNVEATLPPTASYKQAFSVRLRSNHIEYELLRDGTSLGKAAIGSELQTQALTLTARPGVEGLPPDETEFQLEVAPVSEVTEALSHVLSISAPTRKSAAGADPVDVVDIVLTDESPRRAAAFVESLMRGYLERRQSWRNEEASAAERFVAGQIERMKQSLDDAEKKLAEFKKGSDVVALSDEARGMVDQLGRYEEQRVAARMQVSAFARIREMLDKSNVPLEQYLVGETEDPVLSSLSSNLAQAQQELRRDEEKFTGDAPAVQEQRAQVDTQVKMIRAYVVGRYQRAQQQLESLNKMIRQYENKVSTLPRAQLELGQLTRNTEVLSKMYTFLLDQQEQAAVTKASTISKNHVLDSPRIPFLEDAPSLPIRAISGAFVGFLLGVGIVLWRKLAASTFTSETELRSWLGDLPVLAVIPAHSPSPVGPGSRGALSHLELAPRSGFAEAFRLLRANVYRSLPPAGAVIVVTSPSAGDGKSTICSALAAMVAADGRRVAVVDGNPSKANADDVASSTGLAEVLTGTLGWNDAIVRVAVASRNFDFVPAGSPAAAGGDLLSGAAFQTLLGNVRSTYDVVIVEAPPFPARCDAFSLSPAVDAILTVIRVRRSDRAAATAHIDQLVHANPRYGVIINAAHTESPTSIADSASGLWSYGAPPASAPIAHGQSSGG
jgi:tyrosine-protein kinase Etk/Wzc